MMVRTWFAPLLVLVLGAVGFTTATQQLGLKARPQVSSELLVVPPAFVQVVMAGGDRYLAANVAVVRSLLNPLVNDGYERFRGQAKAQLDASWLNPRHEDNYYIAAALLPWAGHVQAGEQILQRAADGRPFDMLPPFFLAFDHFYFDQNPALGAQWMYVAAGRAESEENRTSLSRIASRWAERGSNAQEALKMVQAMEAQARGTALKQYLGQRAERLRVLVPLQEAAIAYMRKRGVPPVHLDDLIKAGLLARIPRDPQGLGFELDAQGMPQLKHPPLQGLPPLVKNK